MVSTFATLSILPSIYVILQRKASIASPSLNPMDPTSRYYERLKHSNPHALVFLCALRAALFAEHVFGFLCAYLCDLCVSAVNRIPASFRFRRGRTGLLACPALLALAAFAQTADLAPVVSKSLADADLPGEFQPFLVVSLHARVAGYVDKVLVDGGAW